MYARHFGLQEDPFSLAPDPRFLFLSERHREALAHLAFGLQGAGGFVLLTGEIGAGKTTVCRAFLERLPTSCRVAWIFNPPRDEDELLQAVAAEFGLDPVGTGRRERLDRLNRYLLDEHAQGRQCVLVVDEAQALPGPVLESLRLLTNLETAERKLLQIVLVGQPELQDQLAEPARLQVAQRVVARYHLDGLTAAECTAYLRHRLAVAGRSGELPFDAPALRRLQQASGGVPRRLNLLAGRALLTAWAQGKLQAGRAEVRQAERELPLAAATGRGNGAGRGWAGGAAWALGTMTVGAALAAVWYATRGASAGPDPLPRQALKASAPVDAPNAAAPAVSVTAPAAPAAAAHSPTGTAGPAVPAWPAEPAPRDTLWAALARDWGITVSADDPCAAGPAAGLACHRSPSLTLATVRALDRPGLVTLVPAQGEPVTARLLGLNDTHALLSFVAASPPDAAVQAWPLPVFAAAWRGDFSTWWRQSPDLPAGREARAAAVARAQLGDGVDLPDGPARTAAVQAFQRATGLTADGVPGTLTLMQWNRATGVKEPRLQAVPKTASPPTGGAAPTESTPAPAPGR